MKPSERRWLAVFVLAVVYRRYVMLRWVSRTMSLSPKDDIHRVSRNQGPGIYTFSLCTCPECVSEFDYAFELVRLP